MRFHFTLLDVERLIPGDEGRELADLEAARREARANARELAIVDSCRHDRVFMVPPANELRGWPRHPDNYNPKSKRDLSKISIAWWLVPSAIVSLIMCFWVLG